MTDLLIEMITGVITTYPILTLAAIICLFFIIRDFSRKYLWWKI